MDTSKQYTHLDTSVHAQTLPSPLDYNTITWQQNTRYTK